LSVFWIITRCLAGSQIFFLDKQSETCQNKFQLWGNQNSIGHMQLIIIATLCLLYGNLSSIWDYILYFLDFECFFWIITRCLAGSEIFFLDKQSETYRKNFQLWGNQSSIWHMQLIIIATSCLLYCHLSSILDYILWFLDFECFLDHHEVHCGIWDIFSWQIIWDLSKKISALRKSKLYLTYAIDHNCKFMSVLWSFIVNFWTIYYDF